MREQIISEIAEAIYFRHYVWLYESLEQFDVSEYADIINDSLDILKIMNWLCPACIKWISTLPDPDIAITVAIAKSY